MYLSKLNVGTFRNIENAEFNFSPGLNLIHGGNGSGKTSLLEAIMTLSRGHSFRTRKFTHLIKEGTGQFTVFGLINVEEGLHRIGIQRARHESRFRVDGGAIQRSTDLTRLFPAQVLDAQAFALLEGGPKDRRAFLDWLVFHVKHNFSELWSNYYRCLKHRNALLRRDKLRHAELVPWNEALAELGVALDKMRRECVNLFIPAFSENVTALGFLENRAVSVEYIPGWDDKRSLLKQFEDSFSRDIRLGYTTLGPHKSDIRIQINDKSPLDVLSRGQQKSITLALYSTLIQSYAALTGRRCAVLIDDLPSELDDQNRRSLIDWLSQLNMQIFATGIFFDQLRSSWPDHLLVTAKVFHVKHGCFTEHTNTFGEEDDR